MRRIALALFTVMAFAFGFTASAGAQDLNCDDFNGDQEAAQRELNSTWPNDPHNLDGDNDGWACEGVFGYTGSVPNAMDQGGNGDTDDGDTDNGDPGDSDTDGTTQLPETGTGSGLGSADTATSCFGIAAAVMLVLGAVARRGEWFRA